MRGVSSLLRLRLQFRSFGSRRFLVGSLLPSLLSGFSLRLLLWVALPVSSGFLWALFGFRLWVPRLPPASYLLSFSAPGSFSFRLLFGFFCWLPLLASCSVSPSFLFGSLPVSSCRFSSGVSFGRLLWVSRLSLLVSGFSLGSYSWPLASGSSPRFFAGFVWWFLFLYILVFLFLLFLGFSGSFSFFFFLVGFSGSFLFFFLIWRCNGVRVGLAGQ